MKTITLIMHGISLVVMFLLLYEFRHIHNKRMALMDALKSPTIGQEMLQRKILMLVYFLSTVSIIVVSLFELYSM